MMRHHVVVVCSSVVQDLQAWRLTRKPPWQGDVLLRPDLLARRSWLNKEETEFFRLNEIYSIRALTVKIFRKAQVQRHIYVR